MNRTKNLWMPAAMLALLLTAGTTFAACNQNKSAAQVAETEAEADVTPAQMEALKEALVRYDQVGSFSEGRAAVKRGDLWGFIDREGKEVIPCVYYYVNNFSDGLASVCKTDDTQLFIDREGNEVFNQTYVYSPYSFNEGRLPYGVANETVDGEIDFAHFGYQGFLDKTGKEVIPADKYDLLIFEGPVYSAFSEGMCNMHKDDATVYIDLDGKELFTYHGNSGEFHEGLAYAWDGNGKCGFIDTTGKVVIGCQYDGVSDFSEGLAWVEKDDKCGYIDRTGKVVIPLEYDIIALYADTEGHETLCGQFRDGLAYVAKNGKFGYIDQTGKVVVPFQYAPHQNEDNEWFDQQPAYDFSQGFARIWKDGKYGFIDTTGKEVFPCQFEEAEDFSEGLALVRRDGKYGFINTEGKCTLD